MIPYYVRLTPGSCDNFEVAVPLILHNEVLGEKISNARRLKVWYGMSSSSMHYGLFHKISGLDIDDSNSSPYRKATLRLEGECEGESVYALWIVDLSSPCAGESIKLSPVPFGVDGRPKLPWKGEALKDFLCLTRVVLLGSIWTSKSLTTKIENTPFRHTLKTFAVNAQYLLDVLFKFGVVERIEGKGYKVDMTSHVFENIFGVKFPS